MYTRLEESKVPDAYSVGNNKIMLVHPTGYSIPSMHIVDHVPHKRIGVSSIIPGYKEKYIYDEVEYFRHIEESMFMVAYR